MGPGNIKATGMPFAVIISWPIFYSPEPEWRGLSPLTHYSKTNLDFKGTVKCSSPYIWSSWACSVNVLILDLKYWVRYKLSWHFLIFLNVFNFCAYSVLISFFLLCKVPKSFFVRVPRFWTLNCFPIVWSCQKHSRLNPAQTRTKQ